MLIIAGVIIVAIAVALVAYPILRPSDLAQQVSEDSQQKEVDALAAQRDETLQAIKDLEFDYRVGKVSAEDFNAFLARLKTQAAEILKRMDALQTQGEPTLTDALEEEIASMRQGIPAPPAPAIHRGAAVREGTSPVEVATLENELEAEIGQVRRQGSGTTSARVCSHCGHTAAPEDRFCGHCRLALPEKVATVCAHCGTPRKPADRFCGKCGKPLPVG